LRLFEQGRLGLGCVKGTVTLCYMKRQLEAPEEYITIEQAKQDYDILTESYGLKPREHVKILLGD